MPILYCQHILSKGMGSRLDCLRLGIHGDIRSGLELGGMTQKNGTHLTQLSKRLYWKDTKVRMMANSLCHMMTTWLITKEYSYVKWWMKIITVMFHMNKTTNMARCTLSPFLSQENTLSKSARKIDVNCLRAVGVHLSITSFRWWLVRRQKKDSFNRNKSMTMIGKCGVERSWYGLTRKTLLTFMKRENIRSG